MSDKSFSFNHLELTTWNLRRLLRNPLHAFLGYHIHQKLSSIVAYHTPNNLTMSSLVRGIRPKKDTLECLPECTWKSVCVCVLNERSSSSKKKTKSWCWSRQLYYHLAGCLLLSAVVPFGAIEPSSRLSVVHCRTTNPDPTCALCYTFSHSISFPSPTGTLPTAAWFRCVRVSNLHDTARRLLDDTVRRW